MRLGLVLYLPYESPDPNHADKSEQIHDVVDYEHLNLLLPCIDSSLPAALTLVKGGEYRPRELMRMRRPLSDPQPSELERQQDRTA